MSQKFEPNNDKKHIHMNEVCFRGCVISGVRGSKSPASSHACHRQLVSILPVLDWGLYLQRLFGSKQCCPKGLHVASLARAIHTRVWSDAGIFRLSQLDWFANKIWHLRAKHKNIK